MWTVNHKACPLKIQRPFIHEPIVGLWCFLTCWNTWTKSQLKNSRKVYIQVFFFLRFRVVITKMFQSWKTVNQQVLYNGCIFRSTPLKYNVSLRMLSKILSHLPSFVKFVSLKLYISVILCIRGHCWLFLAVGDRRLWTQMYRRSSKAKIILKFCGTHFYQSCSHCMCALSGNLYNFL